MTLLKFPYPGIFMSKLILSVKSLSVIRICFSVPIFTGLPLGFFTSSVPQAWQSGFPASASSKSGFIPTSLSCFAFLVQNATTFFQWSLFSKVGSSSCLPSIPLNNSLPITVPITDFNMGFSSSVSRFLSAIFCPPSLPFSR